MAEVKRKSRNPLGKPTFYHEGTDETVYKLCLLNAINDQIADVLGIAIGTLELWMRKHPSLTETMKRGRAYADANVAKALYHRAMGYSCPETKVFCHQVTTTVEKGEGDDKTVETTTKQVVTTVPIIKHYPPDTGACFIWLKNRAGWRDDSNIEIKDKRMPKEQIEQVRSHLQAQFTDRPTDPDVRGEIIDVQTSSGAGSVPSLTGEVS